MSTSESNPYRSPESRDEGLVDMAIEAASQLEIDEDAILRQEIRLRAFGRAKLIALAVQGFLTLGVFVMTPHVPILLLFLVYGAFHLGIATGLCWLARMAPRMQAFYSFAAGIVCLAIAVLGFPSGLVTAVAAAICLVCAGIEFLIYQVCGNSLSDLVTDRAEFDRSCFAQWPEKEQAIRKATIQWSLILLALVGLTGVFFASKIFITL